MAPFGVGVGQISVCARHTPGMGWSEGSSSQKGPAGIPLTAANRILELPEFLGVSKKDSLNWDAKKVGTGFFWTSNLFPIEAIYMNPKSRCLGWDHTG